MQVSDVHCSGELKEILGNGSGKEVFVEKNIGQAGRKLLEFVGNSALQILVSQVQDLQGRQECQLWYQGPFQGWQLLLSSFVSSSSHVVGIARQDQVRVIKMFITT